MKKSCSICKHLDYDDKCFNLKTVVEPQTLEFDIDDCFDLSIKINQPNTFYCSLFKIKRKKDA